MEAPFIPHALPSQTCLSLVFFLNGTIDSAISFRTLWTTFWLAKTSNKPISLTTWLAVDPSTCKLVMIIFRMSNMLSSSALILRCSLCRKFAPLFTQTESHEVTVDTVSTLSNKNRFGCCDKLNFLFSLLIYLLFMSRLAVALLNRKPYSCKRCKNCLDLALRARNLPSSVLGE